MTCSKWLALHWQSKEGNPTTRSPGQCLIWCRRRTTPWNIFYSCHSQPAYVPLGRGARRHLKLSSTEPALVWTGVGNQGPDCFSSFLSPSCSRHHWEEQLPPSYMLPKSRKMPAKLLPGVPITWRKSFGATMASYQRGRPMNWGTTGRTHWQERQDMITSTFSPQEEGQFKFCPSPPYLLHT